jgi:hypothetical protein
MPPHLVNLAVSMIYVVAIVAGGLYLWQYGRSMRRNAAQLTESERLLVQNREQQERFVSILDARGIASNPSRVARKQVGSPISR